MPKSSLTTESTLTDRYQTTVPDMVRKALDLNKKAKIRYTIQADGKVLLTKAEAEESDPVMGSFLAFLAKDMHRHPERLQAMTPELLSRIQTLVGDQDTDLDLPLEDEDE